MTMESVNMDVWKISDFTNRVLKDLSAQFPEEHISIHRNTIDTWFSELEDRCIHFVRRASGEKVYGLEDLDIAKFIFLRRRDKFSKEVIYRILPEHFELRDIPDDYYGNSSNFVDSHFKEEVFGYIQKELEKKTNEIKSIGESIHDYIQQEKDWFIKQKNMLPDPDRKSTRLNSSHVAISYAVFCLKKKKPAKIARGPFGIRRALGDRARRRASGASSAERVNDAARGVAARHGIVLIVLAVICLRHP